jgi:hypothetical protein
MKCPFHKLRGDLPPLTERLTKLPVDERGYPVPFFVAYPDGKPDFRFLDRDKWRRCVKERLCSVCGGKLGRYVTFPIGPMCTITRTSLEAACHKDCAEWSVKGCPFLSRPNMTRRDDDISPEVKAATPGIMIERNPGVTALWTTNTYKIFDDGNGGKLIRVGEPFSVSWWREGREATRAEVVESIKTGLPKLKEQCHTDDDFFGLDKDIATAQRFLPKN